VACLAVLPAALVVRAVSVQMSTGAGAVPADDDNVAVDPDHVDVGAVEGAEALRGEHGVGGSCGPAARRYVEDPVDNVCDGGDLVGDVHHGDAVLAALPVDDRDDLFLRSRVERKQRFVTQEQPRPARQGLGDPQPLLLPTRHQPELAAVPYRPPVDGDRAGRQPEQPEQHLQQRGLARPVRAQDGQALTRSHVQVQVPPDHMVAEPKCGAAQGDPGPAAAVHLSRPAHAEWPWPGPAARPGIGDRTAAWSR